MADKNLYFTVGADIAPGSKAFDQLGRNAAKSMKGVEDSLDDTRTAGQKLADALNSELDAVETTIKGTKEAAKALGQALGPELSSKVDLTDIVTKFQRLGLSVEDIKQDADALADTIRRADGVSLSGLDGEVDKVGDSAKQAADSLEQMGKADVTPVAGGLDEVNKKLGDEVPRSAGSANSALANMYGNSAQSLGGLIGITGDLGMGIGQLGEYAADATLDGERLGSALGSMAKVAGPMVLLGLAVKAVSDAQSRFADSAERTVKDVEAWTGAIDAGGDAAANYAAKLKDAGKVMVDVTRAQSTLTNVVAEADSHWYTTGIGVHFLADALGASKDEVKDITPLLAKAGITAQQFAEAASNPHPAQMQAELAEALKRTTLSADDQKLVLLGVTQAQEDYASAQANAVVTNQVFAKSTDGGTAAMQNLIGSLVDGAVAMDAAEQATKDKAAATATAQVNEEQWRTHLEAATAAQEAQKQAVRDAIDALNDEADALNQQVSAMQSSADAAVAAEDAQQKFIDAARATIETNKDSKSTSEDKREAVDSERDAMIQAANAQVDLAAKNAEASGKTASATEKIDAFNGSLLDNAHFATPAARDAIADYIIKANGVPEEKVTDIKAAIAAGDFETAKQLLDEASRARIAAIKADADTYQANRDLDNLTRDRSVRIIANQVVGGARATGGTVGPNESATRMNEYGPEVAVLPSGTKVIPRAESANMIARGEVGGGRAVTIVINNNGRGVTAETVSNALRQAWVGG